MAVLEHEALPGKPVEQLAVVRDEHADAAVCFERVAHDRPGLCVEVVGGLVEDEHVGELPQGVEGDRQALSLAPR